MSGLKAKYAKHTLRFKQPSGTSRGIIVSKDSWFIQLSYAHDPSLTGIGECSLINGLSIDAKPGFEEHLAAHCRQITESGEVNLDQLSDFPAIRFGVETAFLDLQSGGGRLLFPSAFTHGKDSIPINGLIWMGDAGYMKQQVRDKIEAGYTCLKLKIGAIDFMQELDILRQIRKEYAASDLELRVDANGAFQPDKALEKIKQLSEYDLHSIEQPIRPGQHEAMARLCAHSPLNIGLDEELIGVDDPENQLELLDRIRPQYIIIKPSLVGGFRKAESWIKLTENRNTGWWITSALESNIGLNAIAQWTYTLRNPMPQGLGTGQLYTNNFLSPLFIESGRLFHDPEKNWKIFSSFQDA